MPIPLKIYWDLSCLLYTSTTGDVLIENTVITGSGATDIIAQNGIQINNTENAVINNSVVSDINYTGDVNACGVLLVGGAQAQVNDCTFEDVKQNVSCYDDECAAYVKDGDEVTVITTQHQACLLYTSCLPVQNQKCQSK